MACNCNEGNVYHIGMGCCVPTLVNADNYYTKEEVSEAVENAVEEAIVDNGGITTEIVQEMIDESISSKADKSEIPSLDGYATQSWVESQGYLTQHQDLSNYALKSEIPEKSEIQDISGKQDISGMTAYTQTTAFTQHISDTNVHVTSSEKAAWNNKSDFSGSYNDLTNKPTIPTIWHGTKSEYDAIATKDANTVYLIYES